jgi:glycerophosphoryl diester phosphodiesterase
LSAGKWFHEQFEQEKVPLLSEVLDLLEGKVELNIELKNTPIEYPGVEDDLLEVIADYPQDTLIISSFDHKLMHKLHGKAPHLRIALLAAAVLLDLKAAATAIGANYFHPAFDCLRQDVVEEAHAAGLHVNVWTCNTQSDWRDCLRIGVDGIVSDDPEALKQYLAKVGAYAV